MHIVQLLPDMNLGGVERGVVELSRAIVSTGWRSSVISRHGGLSETIREDGGEPIDFDCGSKNLLTLPKRVLNLRSLLCQLQPTIVHVRSRVPAWLLRFSRSAAPFSTVSTLHGLYRVNEYSRQMTVADAIICPSQAAKDYARQAYSVPPEKLHLIHRGVDHDYFNPLSVDHDFCTDFRQQYQLDGATVIALVGRLSALKGHALFLRAFAQVRQSTPQPLIAIIVGNSGDKHEKALIHLAQQLGISDATRLVGVQRQMREIYQLADIVVSASTQPEAFGRTMAEALAMSRPVIASQHGGALDIIREGENGLFFPSGDAGALAVAIHRALTTEWKDLRASVSQFSLLQMVEKTLALYRQLASGDHLRPLH